MTVAERPTSQYASQDSPAFARDASILRIYVIWLMLIASLLSWRSNAYYSGGLDPTVAAKAFLGLLAAALAVDAAIRDGGRHSRLGCRTLSIIAVYLAVTVLGSLAAGSVMSSGILAVRVAIVAVTVASVFYGWPLRLVLTSAMVSLGASGVIAAATGISSLASGRLNGGWIPVNANQLAVLFGPPTIFLLWRLLSERGSPRLHFPLLIALSALTWLTGSRTGLVALIVAALLVLLLVGRLPAGGYVAGVVALVVSGWTLLFTKAATDYVYRNGTGKISTLNSRTMAWSSAFSSPADFWHRWFGGGLAVKTVSVSGTYWDAQVLDSSWVSAFVQGGIIGMALMAVYALTSLVAAFRCAPPHRPLVVALVVYALIRSPLENGLIDAYVLFVVMLIPAFLSELSDQETAPGPLSSRSDVPRERRLLLRPSPHEIGDQRAVRRLEP